jgi:hypothetical protein
MLQIIGPRGPYPEIRHNPPFAAIRMIVSADSCVRSAKLSLIRNSSEL